jgi:hypothetical protein
MDITTSQLIDLILTSLWILFVISELLFEIDFSTVHLCDGDSEVL